MQVTVEPKDGVAELPPSADIGSDIFDILAEALLAPGYRFTVTVLSADPKPLEYP
jgi:hypothetical protein